MTPETMAAFSDEFEKIATGRGARLADAVGGTFIMRHRIRKLAALATDLRMKGLGGVKRPPEPTEGSKSQAFNMLKNTQKPGSFSSTTPPKFMNPVGPTINQVAPNPFSSN